MALDGFKNEILIEGVLGKKNSTKLFGIRPWKSRYFSLGTQFLKYWNNEAEKKKMAQPRGVIPMFLIKDVEHHMDKQDGARFDIVTPGKSFQLVAETPEIARKWVDLLRLQIEASADMVKAEPVQAKGEFWKPENQDAMIREQRRRSTDQVRRYATMSAAVPSDLFNVDRPGNEPSVSETDREAIPGVAKDEEIKEFAPGVESKPIERTETIPEAPELDIASIESAIPKPVEIVIKPREIPIAPELDEASYIAIDSSIPKPVEIVIQPREIPIAPELDEASYIAIDASIPKPVEIIIKPREIPIAPELDEASYIAIDSSIPKPVEIIIKPREIPIAPELDEASYIAIDSAIPKPVEIIIKPREIPIAPELDEASYIAIDSAIPKPVEIVIKPREIPIAPELDEASYIAIDSAIPKPVEIIIKPREIPIAPELDDASYIAIDASIPKPVEIIIKPREIPIAPELDEASYIAIASAIPKPVEIVIKPREIPIAPELDIVAFEASLPKPASLVIPEKSIKPLFDKNDIVDTDKTESKIDSIVDAPASVSIAVAEDSQVPPTKFAIAEPNAKSAIDPDNGNKTGCCGCSIM